jgi:hypothetical protein
MIFAPLQGKASEFQSLTGSTLLCEKTMTVKKSLVSSPMLEALQPHALVDLLLAVLLLTREPLVHDRLDDLQVV